MLMEKSKYIRISLKLFICKIIKVYKIDIYIFK